MCKKDTTKKTYIKPVFSDVPLQYTLFLSFKCSNLNSRGCLYEQGSFMEASWAYFTYREPYK